MIYPSNDNTAAMIELRAAALARIPEWWNLQEYEDESYGALCYFNGGTPGDDSDGGSSEHADAEWAGFLACRIMRGEEHVELPDGLYVLDSDPRSAK